jgi:NADH:ubiquinone oxidoreductase subunit F (NADH-binding)/(2Fe-2S) ferredoxin
LKIYLLGEGVIMSSYKIHLLVCGGTACVSSQSLKLVDNLNKSIIKHGLTDKVEVVVTGCFGLCEMGPIIKVNPDDVIYVKVQPEDAEEIVSDHVIKGSRIERLLYEEPSLNMKLEGLNAHSYYKKQIRIVLRNCGFINPDKIDEYIANDGYQSLAKCITEMSREDVIDTIVKSGLRGRGGGGYPTGLKWKLTNERVSAQKYIICNADEGDPGSFKDRSILEGDPHSVLEAMAIAGYAIGANHGYIYIRAEYPLALRTLEIAIAQAKELGLLGENILGTGFDFDVELRYGAGAFVCGEETALIQSIEGSRGEPAIKPPFPAESGVWGNPTCINNVETLANIPPIILKGADWFRKIGSDKSPGTKVFSLSGNIKNVGLVEVPFGTSLREVIYGISGGIKDDKKFKAVQTGGSSGGCITSENLDIPIDYETLNNIGSMMGSGGMVVMDQDNCMVNIAKFFLEFNVDESCGKCTPCRIGTKRLYEMLEKITYGNGTEQDLVDLKELCDIIKDTALCGLGQAAPNPILSTINYFYDEYLAHVRDKKCPAGVCQALITPKIPE